MYQKVLCELLRLASLGSINISSRVLSPWCLNLFLAPTFFLSAYEC